MQKVYCNLIGDYCSLVRTYANEKIYDVTFKEYRLGRVSKRKSRWATLLYNNGEYIDYTYKHKTRQEAVKELWINRFDARPIPQD